MGFALARPSDAELRARLAGLARAEWSYAEPGASRDPARLVRERFARRYFVDHRRIRLGSGLACFERASSALASWQPLRVGWIDLQGVEACPTSRSLHSDPDLRSPADRCAQRGLPPLAAGACIGMLTRAAGLWCWNACRVVYVDAETGPVETRAFGWGTLPAHSLRGEERFAVEYHRGNGSVWYDVLAFSRPRHPLALAGLPLVRRLQRRFGRDSAAALQRALADP